MNDQTTLKATLDAIHEQMKALTRAVNDARKDRAEDRDEHRAERNEDRRLLVDAVGVISRFDDRLRELSTRIARLDGDLSAKINHLDVKIGEESAELKSIIRVDLGGSIAHLETQIGNELHEIDDRLSRIEEGEGPSLNIS